MKINTEYLKDKGRRVLDKILIFSKDNKNNILIVVGAIVCALIVTLFVPTSGIDASKEAQQLQSLSSNIRKHYRNRPDYWGLDAKAAINMQIVPLDMLKDHQITSIWNTPILIGAAPDGNILMPGSRSFDVIYKHLDKKQCVALASYKFDETFWLGVIQISIANDNQNKTFNWNGGENSLPIKPEVAKKSCKSLNTLVFHFE